MQRNITKRNSMFTITLLLATIQVINPGSEQSSVQKDISGYLPKPGELEEWEPVGSPQKFVGEDLYLLINGGAVIYYEYGFKQVITQECVNKDGKSINLEIYEMTNTASAYGIYSFKISGDGEEIAVGTDGLLEGYYLNFWKGNFLVTLTAYDSDKMTLDGLLAVARAVDTKIGKEGKKPSLIELLPKEKLRSSDVKYLKGELSLSNNYEFDSENIFGLKEGAIGDYGDFKIFLFKYEDEKESRKWFENARDHLKESSRFEGFTDHGDDFSITDRVKNHIYARQNQDYIFIFMGTEEIDPKIIFEKLADNIR